VGTGGCEEGQCYECDGVLEFHRLIF